MRFFTSLFINELCPKREQAFYKNGIREVVYQMLYADSVIEMIQV